MNGILPLWKPKGMTSHDCVMRIRRLFGTKKVGHTGTLDPEVEGLLPICIGQATKVVPYLMETNKTYIAEVKLGIATDTEDSEGQIITRKEVSTPPSEQAVKSALQAFKGEIVQVPPMYSAVKVNGKKLYEYARANETVERPKRKVIIYDILSLPSKKQNKTTFRLKVVCSKGTYIRTLCVDIGKKLGYPAHMSDLIRTETGSFTEEESVTFDTIEETIKNGRQEKLLLPMVRGLQHLKRLSIDEEGMKARILHGQKLSKPDSVVKAEPFIFMFNDQLLAIYQIHPEKPDLIKPVRVFNG
ncbi:MAG TPA: tRNA pseudouridine(55) synthase TruB [Virgibacillus sp.]|nr:tRNA pseudouridine(55) synthase TruB [Virgibacillus sp.]